MNCKEVCEKIYSLADNELNAFNKKQVMKHLKNCKSCSEIYTQVIEMKNLITSEITIDDFKDLDIDLTLMDNHSEFNEIKLINKSKKSNSNWRYLFMKKKVIAASITLLLVVSVMVPVNGQSLVDKVSDWVKSLSFSSEVTKYEVTTDTPTLTYVPEYQREIDSLWSEMTKLMNAEESQLERKKIYDKYQAMIEEIRQQEEDRVAKFRTGYDVISDLTDDFEYDFQIPDYIPEEYSFDDVEHYTFDEGLCNIITLRYKKPDLNSGHPSLYINYEFVKQDIPERELAYTEDTVVKAVKVDDYNAVLIFDNSDTSQFADVGIDVIVDEGDFKMIRINMFVDKFEVRNGVPADIESDLIKIAESILD